MKRNPNYTKFDPRTAQVMCLIMLIVIFVGLLIGCKSTEKQDNVDFAELREDVRRLIKDNDSKVHRYSDKEIMDRFIKCDDIMADIKKVDMGAY